MEKRRGSVRGQTVVITGASNGIGRAAVRELAASGAKLVLMVRNPVRGSAVADAIAAERGQSDCVSVVQCDLNSFASVRSAVSQIASEQSHIDVLINNAGLIAPRRTLTEDGNELTFQVNHLSHFLLTSLLHRQLMARPGARVVNVSSDAHLRMFRGLKFNDLGYERGWSPFKAYAASKLANIMFTYELARRWSDDGISANAVHPGVVDTGFGGRGWGLSGFIWETFVPKITEKQGAETVVMLASSPSVEGVTGGYFYRNAPKRSSRASYDREAQARLWDLSARLTGQADGAGSR